MYTEEVLTAFDYRCLKREFGNGLSTLNGMACHPLPPPPPPPLELYMKAQKYILHEPTSQNFLYTWV